MASGNDALISLLGGLHQQQPQQTPMLPQQGVLPPTNPVQAQTPPDVDTQLKQQSLQQSQLGTQAFQQGMQNQQQDRARLLQLQQQLGSLPVPQQGYQPNFQPMDSPGHVLGDVGKALLLGLGSTGPGRTIQQGIYGPGERRYETQAGALSKQIEEIQNQQKVTSEGQTAAGNMAYRPGMTIARETQAQASIMNAQTRQIAEQHKLQLQTEGNRIREELGKGKLTQEAARTRMMEIIARETNATRHDVANIMGGTRESVEQQQAAEQDFKEMSDHWLQSFLGLGPEKPVTTAAGRGGVKAKPAPTGGPKPGTVEDGHRFKGGNPADPNSWEKVR